MNIQMSKFGNLLNGRPAAREALLRMAQIIDSSDADGIIALDFKGVEVLTTSYADEILSGLKINYPNKKVEIINKETAAVREALDLVQKQ